SWSSVDGAEVPGVGGAGDEVFGWFGEGRRITAPLRDHHDPMIGRGEYLTGYMERIGLDVRHGTLAHPGQQVGEALRVGPDLPHPYDHSAGHYTVTVVSGRAESAGRSSRLGATPAAISRAPRAATIAPLSVHSFGRGTRTVMPYRCARSAA